MPFLSSDEITALKASTVRLAMLVELQFASETMRLWNGAGTATIDGADWRGVGGFGSIDGLEQVREPVSSKVTMRLSGVSPEVLALAARSNDDVRGRPAYVWTHLMDGDWQPVGARIPLFWGTMQRINIERSEASEFSGGDRVCALEVENPFAARARPSAGRFTDADQKARFPGDKFCRFVPLQRSQVIVWPDY
jgi:hypothetical protein